MFLNGVYLVADETLDGFHEEVQALQAEFDPHGIELVCTGPWPAYNFVPGTIGAAW
jgi:gas vesicle protein GvpL/GvpF